MCIPPTIITVVGLIYMTTPKFITQKAITNADDFNDFSCSERTERIKYEQIHKDCINACKDPKIATGLAIKLCLQGQRIKVGDWFAVAGKTYDCETTLKEMLAYQMSEGIISAMPKTQAGEGIGKHSNKRMISVARICRAFAPTVIFLISKSKLSLSAENEAQAKEAGLPLKYGFIDAPYGMDDDEVTKNRDAFRKFCVLFTKGVRMSYNSGNMDTKTGVERDHAVEFDNYLKWRGLELN